MQPRRFFLCFLLFLPALANTALSQDKFEQRSGEYTVYYSLFPSSFLLPEVAESTGITRARDRAILNVSVRRGEGGDSREQSALVRGTSSDLIHSRELEFKEIREQGAIYYLAEIRVSSQAKVYFDLQVAPDPNKPAIEVRFNREVYPE